MTSMDKRMRLGTVAITDEQFARLSAAREEFTMDSGADAEDLIAEFRLRADRGDMWGSVLVELFDLCDLLTFRGDHVPADWEYRLGALGPEEPGRGDLAGYDGQTLVSYGDFLITMRDVLEEQDASY
tara:strand:- start:96 stop:476 length:381 start_codon:yes stop_codon:yes gene_type:complete